MSKHFFYNYKDDLEIKLKKVYRKDLKALEENRSKQAQLDQAHGLIQLYYEKLLSTLEDIISVSDGSIECVIEDDVIKFKMYDHYVKYTRFDQGIEVEIGVFDEDSQIVEARINSNIIPSDKRCVVKKIGKVHDGAHFDENTINYYMNEAFSHLDILK